MFWKVIRSIGIGIVISAILSAVLWLIVLVEKDESRRNAIVEPSQAKTGRVVEHGDYAYISLNLKGTMATPGNARKVVKAVHTYANENHSRVNYSVVSDRGYQNRNPMIYGVTMTKWPKATSVE